MLQTTNQYNLDIIGSEYSIAHIIPYPRKLSSNST